MKLLLSYGLNVLYSFDVIFDENKCYVIVSDVFCAIFIGDPCWFGRVPGGVKCNLFTDEACSSRVLGLC